MPSEGAKGVPESLLTPPWELHRSEQLSGMHLTFSCSSGILPAGKRGGRSWQFKDTAQCPLLTPGGARTGGGPLGRCASGGLRQTNHFTQRKALGAEPAT